MKKVIKISRYIILGITKLLNFLATFWVGYFIYSRIDLMVEEGAAGLLDNTGVWAYIVVFIVTGSAFVFLLKSLLEPIRRKK